MVSWWWLFRKRREPNPNWSVKSAPSRSKAYVHCIQWSWGLQCLVPIFRPMYAHFFLAIVLILSLRKSQNLFEIYLTLFLCKLFTFLLITKKSDAWVFQMYADSPRIVRPIPNIEATLGERIEVHCEVDSNPPANIEWRVGRGGPGVVGVGSVLHLSMNNDSAFGEYSCVARVDDPRLKGLGVSFYVLRRGLHSHILHPFCFYKHKYFPRERNF